MDKFYIIVDADGNAITEVQPVTMEGTEGFACHGDVNEGFYPADSVEVYEFPLGVYDLVTFANAATNGEEVDGRIDWVFPVGIHGVKEYDVVTDDNMYRVQAQDIGSAAQCCPNCGCAKLTPTKDHEGRPGIICESEPCGRSYYALKSK